MDVAELCDRAEIRMLMDRYALACDTLDWDALRELFTEDCVIDYSEFGGGRGNLESTVAWLNAGLSRYAGLHHNMTTHHCEIDGTTARAITYWLAYQTRVDGAGGETVMHLGGFYRDRLLKTPEGWRIIERVDVGTWLPDPLPARLDPPPSWYGTNEHHRAVLAGD